MLIISVARKILSNKKVVVRRQKRRMLKLPHFSLIPFAYTKKKLNYLPQINIFDNEENKNVILD